MQSEDLDSLLVDAERSPMFKVRIYLMQMQNNHKECLETYFKVPAIREDVFVWLNDLEVRQRVREGEGDDTGTSRDLINTLILNYIPKLVSMDASQAIKLVEQWLMSPDASVRADHLTIVDERLKGDNDAIFEYLSTLLREKKSEILEQHQNLLMGGA